MSLEVVKPQTSKFLVFTSAGNYSNIHQWCEGASFDLFVVYYGDTEGTYREIANYYLMNKAGKFQNLYYAMQEYRKIFLQYDSIFVADDDILISGDEINQLFELLVNKDLFLLQPAFDPRGKVSHKITTIKPFSSIRYTNFVEVTCPMFKTSVLVDFIDVFDPIANGGGVNWWFCDEVTKKGKKNKIAIVDDIWCTNPHDIEKSGVREIDKFKSRQERNNDWKFVRKKHSLTFRENVFFTYEVERNYNVINFCNYLFLKIEAFRRRVNVKLKKIVKRR